LNERGADVSTRRFGSEERVMTDGVAEALARNDTFPKLLLRNAASRGDRPAMREKDLGIWQAWSWADVLDEIRPFTLGLAELGIKRGDKVAIIGQNRPRLYWSMCAIQALGGVPVPLYADSVAEEMAYVLAHAEVVAAVVEDQEQVDKVLSVSDDVPNLHKIVYDEPRGLRDYDHTNLHSIDDVQATGREIMGKDGQADARFKAAIAEGKGGDLAILLYTSGTTGRPKGVMLTFDNLVISANNGNGSSPICRSPGSATMSFPMPSPIRRAFASTARKARKRSTRTGAKSGRAISSRRRGCSKRC
jgi:long-chain acyl-CoA synthetase